MREKFLKAPKNLLVPIAIVVGGVVAFTLLVSEGPQVKPQPKTAKLPGVQVMRIQSEDITIPVQTRGIVNPATQVELTSEVSGTVTKVSPKLSNGSYFRKGDWLLKVDPSHYELELSKAKAELAKATTEYKKTRASVRSGQAVSIDIQKSDLAKGIPQLQQAQAMLDAAQAAVDHARKQKEKTILVAPFDGRVMEKNVDIKEFLSTGVPVAKIYSVDRAEVRLPLTTDQLDLVDVPLRYVSETSSHAAPRVMLEDATGKYRWFGRIVRSEGNIDPRNRQVYVVASIENPYARDEHQSSRPPLAAGSYVNATIEGRVHKNVFSLPLDAVHNMNEVWTLDDDNRLHVRKVDVMYRGKDRVYISSGLEDAEKVVVTLLDVVVEDMEVAILSEINPLEPVIASTLFSDDDGGSATASATDAEAEQSAPAAKTDNKAAPKAAPEPSIKLDPDDMAGMMGLEEESDI